MIWSLERTDNIVGMMFGLGTAIILALIFYVSFLVIAWTNNWTIKLRRKLSCVSLALTLSIALIGVYVTYSIFRNQAQQNAEFSLSNQGTDFVNWERESPEIICLYQWHAFDDAVECRKAIFASPFAYRKTMLYIEETLFMLETAEADRDRWGSRFAEDIKFWADDVSEDPTGMFAYNLVSENRDPAAAAGRSGLSMSPEKLCSGFAAVVIELSNTEGSRLSQQIATNPLEFCKRKLAAEQANSGVEVVP